MFHDPDLDALETQVAVANQNIAAALANFQAARAVVKQSRAQYFPTVTASPQVTRSRQFYAPTTANPQPAPFTATSYALPFDASWEPDFWGGIRNAVQASSLEAQATFADLGNVRLTVQAEAAVDYFQLRVLDGQRQLLDKSVQNFEESLKLTQDQFDSGMASGQDVEQAATLLDTSRAQATDLGIQRALLEHAIATLLGKPPAAFAIAPGALALKPVPIPSGVPSQLLERRPDIAAAERRVAEANARIGVARAAYFPTTILGATAGYQGSTLGNLVSSPNLLWSLGASLTQTIFDGGRLKAITEQARAVYQGTVANYRQTVLGAFQDVEDDLSTLRILDLELRQQDAAVASSQRYLAFAVIRYQAGLDIYLDVITAQTVLLSNQRTAMGLRMQQMTANVQLVKALGGGWDRSQPPPEAKP
jgi:NodT family efflux transporter outer membrane factor (OMF) lipoprotein